MPCLGAVLGWALAPVLDGLLLAVAVLVVLLGLVTTKLS